MTDDSKPQLPAEPDASTRLVTPQMSPEFYLRVNDFIEMANRIERRYDSHHAYLPMLHGFSRYCAHHYRTASTRVDNAENRDAFSDEIGAAVKDLILGHLEDLAGPPPAPATAAADGAPAADTPDGASAIVPGAPDSKA